MAPAHSNSRKTSDSPAVAALTEIARLLARQAARELAERQSEGNQPSKPAPSEGR